MEDNVISEAIPEVEVLNVLHVLLVLYCIVLYCIVLHVLLSSLKVCFAKV
jgi:hypothetical protein